MSLYINFENQSLLWNIIHKNSYANQFFLNTPNLKKEEWFKSIIQIFYSQNQSRELTINELQKINQDTLLYMLDSIRTMSNHINNQPLVLSNQQPLNNLPVLSNQQPLNNLPVLSNQQPLNNLPVLSNQPSVLSNQQPLHNLSDKTIVGSRNEHAFNIRQKEYHQMLDKKVPENVNFTDVVADQAISNMDELVQQHIKQRENELRAYAPPPIVSNTIKIDNANENVKLVVDGSIDSPKKTVTWANESTNDQKQLQESMFYEEFLTLKNQVLELSNKILILEQQNK
jgi:hypothetical protein